ncbi:MAG TPA: hypothetical protein VNI01_16320 [Elusimicrobiota bacterium]|nr:hypothetical protein [Elusimicrobiota bacterium]
MRNRRGQISLPSLFVLPSLFLFVYLIFETAKLSREKIRHQFALDSAAFIEMTNYSDFLNRSAYVNGAFPQRIFYEGFYNTCIEKKNNTGGDCGAAGDRLYEILYKNGAFPRSSSTAPDASLDNQSSWSIVFGGTGAAKNTNPPSVDPKLELLTMQDALDYWLSWDDAQDIYKLYVQIYQLLGSVEDAQWSVFKRLTQSHNFFRKSYWLNTNDPIGDAYSGSAYFNRSFRPQPYCIEEIMIYGNKPTNNAFQPYQIWAPNSPISMPNTIQGCSPAGLFQIMSIPDSDLSDLRSRKGNGGGPGYPIVQHWKAPGNYFNVDFNREADCRDAPRGRPCVHATIGAIDTTAVGGLWPNPTPKFQSRLSP